MSASSALTQKISPIISYEFSEINYLYKKLDMVLGGILDFA
ncbi:hypothetical protein KIS4809_0013 [Bacillus sp. ZZV12-4809]|nr:hypothetical protein KIS4809_0013 [Bacillus sp. ZZV12-4809]